ncbi:hypothetical protein [Bradyrhizobium tunisiense]|uniref:hypothetical protein n=1 Tax=Bradyrhizobium tunisiense TaxID=3278709 RepID=UPI0035D829DC
MAVRRRKKQPYNPAKVHDRMATEFSRGVALHVAPIDVDDPFAPGDKIRVMRALRDDPLGRLHDRSQIDEAQFLAGRAFQDDFEEVERGPKAIDPGKEAVDGGVLPEPITEAQQRAAKMLSKAYRVLGQDGAALAHDVLIHGRTMRSIAAGRGMVGRRWEEYFGMRFQECLHSLARLYGFATEATGRKRVVGDTFVQA